MSVPPIPSPIAIDGPAAAGKGTLARKLAAHFNFAHLDTGALYRSVAHLVLQAEQDPNDARACVEAVQQLNPLAIDKKAIRTNQIAAAAAKVAAHPQVREKMLNLQRHFAAHPPDGKAGAVLEGRDIGTIICPDAPLKLFITARVEIRAKRRWLELKPLDSNLQEAQILAAVQARDKKDFNRPVAPLKQAEDALLLDTSDLAIKDVFKAALALIKQKVSEIQTAQNIS